MHRRDFLRTVAAAGAVAAGNHGGAESAAETIGRSDQDGLTIGGVYPANIVRLGDGSLVTEKGHQSTDGGRTWTKSKTFTPGGGLGLLRLSNGQLGTYYADKWTMATALGNDANNWFFRWSSDEGKTWSKPIQITLPGLTMGLNGTMFALGSGRLILLTYSQFLGSRFDKRGASWGTYKGVRFQTETEGHFPLSEVCRCYFCDDHGRTWKACDGWIMGWRDRRWTDAITEPSGVELKDGRIMLVARAVTGRLYQAFSEDGGYSWWPGAEPMSLMASYSPARICRLPKTGHLLVVWNQLSRAEIRKGLRRSRLSCAVSKDEGKTWGCFKNLEAIECLGGVTHVAPDPDFAPVWGADEVGAVPDDYANFHYPHVSVVGDEVFISYLVARAAIGKEKAGKPKVIYQQRTPTRILPVGWFYA